MKNIDLTVLPWSDYELLDSGDNSKLERYGKFIIARPETQAIWKPARPELWKRATAEFKWADGKGRWERKKEGGATVPESWQLSWRDVRFVVRLTSFKHTGVFPEQAANWEWIEEKVKKATAVGGFLLHSRQPQPRQPHVLNLFGYTGIASIVAAKADALVTHVDASKQSNEWAKENAQLSGVPAGSIKFLLDDALKFAERELRRGASYDGIILDPPAFGRGAKGEVWHIEEQLPRLLGVLAQLLTKKPAAPGGAFFLLNGYAAGYSAQSFLQAVEDAFIIKNTQEARVQGEFGELNLQESSDINRGNGKSVVPQGIYVRFTQ